MICGKEDQSWRKTCIYNKHSTKDRGIGTISHKGDTRTKDQMNTTLKQCHKGLLNILLTLWRGIGRTNALIVDKKDIIRKIVPNHTQLNLPKNTRRKHSLQTMNEKNELCDETNNKSKPPPKKRWKNNKSKPSFRSTNLIFQSSLKETINNGTLLKP